jgi:hypothetical protein
LVPRHLEIIYEINSRFGNSVEPLNCERIGVPFPG